MSTPLEHCHRLGRVYPRLWRVFGAVRQPAQRRRLGDWPEHIFASPYALFEASAEHRCGHSPAELADLSLFFPAAAWRTTQGVYVYDETLMESLWQTPLQGDLPVTLLTRLPEWAPYIEIERDVAGAGYVYGMWAYVTLAMDPSNPLQANNWEELVLVLSCEAGAAALPGPRAEWGRTITVEIALAEGRTVQQAVDRYAAEVYQVVHEQLGYTAQGAAQKSAWVHSLEIAPLLNLVLYLCAENADLARHGVSERPTRPVPAKTRRGEKLFPPPEPRKWEVGWRVGAALRKALGAHEGEGAQRQGPRPHVRRAHWHTFLTGPRTGEQKRVLRWLPPIPVNVEGVDDLVPTVRRVDGPG